MHMSCATETPEYPCEPCHSAALQCARIAKQVCTEPHASHHLLLLFSLLLSLLYPFLSDAARSPICTHFPQMRSVFAS